MAREWETEAEFYIQRFGIDIDKARTFTILRWMHHGDLRPLAAAIAEGHKLHEAVLNKLADMIQNDRIKVSGKRGHPKSPEVFARDLIAAQSYFAHEGRS